MSITLSALQKQRRDTAANWTAENPTLLAGEIGIESDTGKIKIGNGSTAWTSLSYQGIIPSSGAYPLSQLLMPSGTVSAPSISFDGDTNLGIYRSGTDQLSFTTAGTERLRIDATGQIEAVSLGTAAAPTFSWTGDLNTGIYSPGADQVAISTAGSGRLFVDASGRVGVGTTGPGLRLDVAATGDDGIRLSTTGTNNSARLELSSGNGTTSGKYAYIQVRNNDTNAQGYAFGTFGDDRWVIRDTKANSERLCVDSSGRVGIGTSSPSGLLHLGNGTSNSDIILDKPEAGAGTLKFYKAGSASAYIQYDAGEDLVYYSPSGSGSQVFYTGGTARVTINNSGSVGIGTTSPANQLQLSTDSAGKPSTNTWTIVSDERIKEEIELADLDLCYEAIKSIPLKRFKWKDEVYTEEQVRDRRKLGWIAQDVEAVFPKAVGTYEFKYNQVFEETIIPAIEEVLDDEGNVTTPSQPERIEKGELISEDVIEDCRDLNSDQLYAAMYGAIQKLMAKVETLEAEVAALKAN